VGDGTFLFSVPGSVYWISKRYNIPVLTIVLNNKGKSASNLTCTMSLSLTLSGTVADKDRMERPAEVSPSGPPRRVGLEGDERRDQYLL